MFCAHKNSYLQLVSAVDPRVIDKAVTKALAPRDAPSAFFRRIVSMQPSLYAPHCDVTRANLGFGRVGLRLIIRDLHSRDPLLQLQALHSVLDQVQITENAMFLINLHIVYRLIDLILHENDIVKERVCLIYTHLAKYHQGRSRVLMRPIIIEKLTKLIMEARGEIRYAAGYALYTLSRHQCVVETMVKVKDLVKNLLEKIQDEHQNIVLVHLKTLCNLTEWDQEIALRCNAFQVMHSLFDDEFPRAVCCTAMKCMAQLLRHPVGKELADIHDVNAFVIPLLQCKKTKVLLSATRLMEASTLTTRSKWRLKERCTEVTKSLVGLCQHSNEPVLQLQSMQVLINLCDSPDIRHHMKAHWEHKIMNVKIRTADQWDGTSEATPPGLDTGHYYRTVCLEGVETVRNFKEDCPLAVDVHNYLETLHAKKKHLIYAINWKSYKN
ncbi:hypothetical protein EVAR_60537_1 [Eumeta japonica]|uniref:Uncharacterized protein n=1 Tax=Eumeta variegata TaxID=151549 RepID=A0A4C1YTL0_EUMVA|nr:hypothetical protein EVAR_60537_1 [Eumeta japonica]